ncbi:MAG: MoaD/ThiS family protein [Anaerolineae bacterium]
MSIILKYSGPMVSITSSRQEDIVLEDEQRATVADVLAQLCDRYGPAMQEVLSNEKEPERRCRIFLNERGIQFLNSLDTIVEDGDRLTFLFPLGGG